MEGELEGAHLSPSLGVVSIMQLAVDYLILKSMLSTPGSETSFAQDHSSITMKDSRQESIQSPNSHRNLNLGQNHWVLQPVTLPTIDASSLECHLWWD